MTQSSFNMHYPSLANQPLIDVLRLIRTLNVGPITFFQLMQRFKTAAKALEALPDLSTRGGRARPLHACPKDQAEREIEAVEKYGARMLLYGEADYPQLLHAIIDPPPVITVMGHTHLWRQKNAIAIVGSRNASANGCAFAQKLSTQLGEEGLLVVSGLARGIDSFSHRGALSSGTVGVIAGGIDNIYPPENEILFNHIRETGAIISEQPFGSLPYSGSFPGRNRIISGMSVGTLIVEASPRSGSLITAKFALEQGREVFAVPGSPLDPRAKGCNMLIKEGAHMVESVQDVLNGIAHLRHHKFEEGTPLKSASLHEIPQENIDSADRVHLLNKLSYSAVSIDELVAQSNLPAATVQVMLLELELAGKIQRTSGNKVVLCADMEEKRA